MALQQNLWVKIAESPVKIEFRIGWRIPRSFEKMLVRTNNDLKKRNRDAAKDYPKSSAKIQVFYLRICQVN